VPIRKLSEPPPHRVLAEVEAQQVLAAAKSAPETFSASPSSIQVVASRPSYL